jgi:hypothetical protein
MNWFNLQDLENRLSENSVSDQEGFYYLLANLILFGLGSYGASDTYHHGGFIFAEIVIMLTIIIVGLNLTFKANQNGDGHNYFKRFLALYFVIGIRLLVFVLLLAIPAGILGFFIFGEEISNTFLQDLLFLGLYAGIGIIYYYFLVRSFKKVAQSNPQAE